MKIFLSILGILVFDLIASGVAETPTNRVVVKSLMVTNSLDFGDWGTIQYCPDGSFASAVNIKTYYISNDETALNSIMLFCTDLEGQKIANISSTVGSQGTWQHNLFPDERSCDNGLMTGMRAQVLPEPGYLGDNQAVQNVEMECNYGETVISGFEDDGNVLLGQWSVWQKCDAGTAICGIMVRYQEPDNIVDTVAVSDYFMYCCPVSGEVDTTSAPSGTTEKPIEDTTTTDNWKN